MCFEDKVLDCVRSDNALLQLIVLYIGFTDIINKLLDCARSDKLVCT
ncbi:hypothetical protein FLAVO9AF_230110 [Flavobacterium sp. 9AF]|nr:hypothetical protein FLAVO9AF_230110 [Flavobacterium sp. 9AF]